MANEGKGFQATILLPYTGNVCFYFGSLMKIIKAAFPLLLSWDTGYAVYLYLRVLVSETLGDDPLPLGSR